MLAVPRSLAMLDRWVHCHHTAGRITPSAITVFDTAVKRARRVFARGSTHLDINISARLAAPHQKMRDAASRNASAERLLRAPSRAQFNSSQPCAVAVYEAALRRYGPRGGRTVRHTQLPHRRDESCAFG